MHDSDSTARIDRLAKAVAAGINRRALIYALGSGAIGLLRGSRPEVSARINGARVIRYVALGDSVASGHGLLDNDGSGCVPDGVSCCHRSRLGYPWIVAESLTALGYEVAFDTDQHLACSSARSEHLDGQIDAAIAQLSDQAAGDVVFLSVTIGVNDFAWDSPSIVRHFVESDRRFTAWVEEIVGSAVAQVSLSLDRLFAALPAARVVLTAYHNPLNRSSFVFSAMGCGSLPTRMSCYDRTEFAVTTLNGAMADLVSSMSTDRPIRFTPDLHAAFHANGGHEAPGLGGGIIGGLGLCGFSGPSVRDTWVQYPGDPESNSVFAIAGIPNVRGAGDCFHPNRHGARAFAEAVVLAGLDLLPGPETSSSTGTGGVSHAS